MISFPVYTSCRTNSWIASITHRMGCQWHNWDGENTRCGVSTVYRQLVKLFAFMYPPVVQVTNVHLVPKTVHLVGMGSITNIIPLGIHWDVPVPCLTLWFWQWFSHFYTTLFESYRVTGNKYHLLTFRRVSYSNRKKFN